MVGRVGGIRVLLALGRGREGCHCSGALWYRGTEAVRGRRAAQ